MTYGPAALVVVGCRALHCQECRVCVQDCDHHCPWTGKCIGKNNVKCFYAWLLLLIVSFVYEMIEFTAYTMPAVLTTPPLA